MSALPPLNRRSLLRAAALAALAVPLAASTACSGYDDSPDELLPLWERAEADAAAAKALAGSADGPAEVSALAEQVAAARSAQASALKAELDRLNKPRPDGGNTAPPRTAADLAALRDRLSEAGEQAATLTRSVPAFRAGLTGSVAAGCAALRQLSPELGAGQPGKLDPASTGKLPSEALDALQRALAAEHAAVWVYGLVSAFLPADFGRGIDAGAAAHRDRRDACERVLAATGTAPVPAETAYLAPEEVTDEASAVALVITAEQDAAAAWHGVLERTDDAGLRTLACDSLIGSATRGTSWRMEAGRQPAAVALPGRE
ncbi:ferritin-like domain-containing protein [Saccharomonospora sp. NPDC006951]